MDDSHNSMPHFDFEGGEILNIDKPGGLTSFGVVERIRRWTGCRKVGHAGTLDPLATGVLLICTGRATKRVSEFMEMEKEYEGTVELGITTETDDGEGKIKGRSEVPQFTRDEIETIVKHLQGTIGQIPPMYSALKKDGQRLYKLARQGKVVHREPRKVTIHEIVLMKWENPDLHIRVRCSKGTYIRALARDIGKRCGTGGTLKSLRRTRVGPYRVEDAYLVNTLKAWFAVKHECI